MSAAGPRPVPLAVYETIARVGPASENRIHDDDVAQRFGFSGGLVPGVSVYAYMSHPVLEHFGRAFLERGQMEARFQKPFYDGEKVRVEVVQDGDVRVAVTARNPSGEACATGWAFLPPEALPAPDPDSFEVTAVPTVRPLVTRAALAKTTALGTVWEFFEPSGNGREYLELVPDSFEGYHGPEPVAPTGFLIRRANSALSRNFVLPAWVHVSSLVTHFSTLGRSEEFSTRGRVVDLFERKGHQFVRIEVLLLAGDIRPVAHIDHTAIYELRGT